MADEKILPPLRAQSASSTSKVPMDSSSGELRPGVQHSSERSVTQPSSTPSNRERQPVSADDDAYIGEGYGSFDGIEFSDVPPGYF